MRLSRIEHCTKGSTIIEYAIALPILIWLVIGIIEYSLVLYGSAVLGSSIANAARQAQPDATASPPTDGYVSSGMSEIDYIQSLVQGGVFGLLDPQKVTISSFPAAPTFGIASKNYQPVVYTATYPWPIFTPFMQNVLGKKGIFTLTESAIVVNPPLSPAVR